MKDLKIKIALSKESNVGLLLTPEVFSLLGTIQKYPKGAPNRLKRLIRIRLNIFRELKAFDKELKRHKLIL